MSERIARCSKENSLGIIILSKDLNGGVKTEIESGRVVKEGSYFNKFG